MQPCENNCYLEKHISLLRSSYLKLTGLHLVDPQLSDFEAAEQIFNAPFAIVSHNTDPEPVFNYANRTAMTLFEMSWQEFTSMTSKSSAEPMNRKDRDRLLEQVRTKGFAQNYEGIRISKKGKRFIIKNVTVWNLIDEQGHYQGQGAIYDRWLYL